MERVDRKSMSECWFWDGFNQDKKKAHPQIVDVDDGKLVTRAPVRIIWEHTHGRKLTNKEYLSKTCGHAFCCNPFHTTVVDKNELMDMARKSQMNELSASTVSGIKSDLLKGCSISNIARKYKIKPYIVSSIATRKTYVDVEPILNKNWVYKPTDVIRLREIGDLLGLTKQRVSQLIKRGFLTASRDEHNKIVVRRTVTNNYKKHRKVRLIRESPIFIPPAFD